LLLLFDIDGTLIRERPLAHQRAMIDAVERVYGVEFAPGEEPIAEVVPHGKTDRQIVREILSRREIGDGVVDAGFEEFERLSCELHRDLEQPLLTGDARGRTAAMLGRLAGAGHTLALLTGNLEPIARRKMELAGLGDFFATHEGAFGSDAEARPELVPIARRRAGGADGAHPAADTVIIGDTPQDVEAAHADGARAIAITGRRYGRDDLERSGADAVVDDLDEVDGVLAGWHA
jgi:phosphoglycolate phosphatase-like HAD superfamily hydrolase